MGICRYSKWLSLHFGHLDRLPWIVGRLDLPGVRDKAIALFNRVPLARHIQLVRELFDVTTPGNLREEVDLITPDGGNVQPQLSMVLKGVQASPMDDKVQETPHAIVKKAMASAASYGFPWAASSSRLAQNLEDAEEIPPAVNRDLQTEWDRWSSVQKFTHTERAQKATKRWVTRRMYFMESALDLGDVGADEEGPADAGDADDSGGDDLADDDGDGGGLPNNPLW